MNKNLLCRYLANLSSECSNLLTFKIKWNKYKEHNSIFLKGSLLGMFIFSCVKKSFLLRTVPSYNAIYHILIERTTLNIFTWRKWASQL